ncbi:hypothetical protein CRUP_010430 [Coryphaenoides rupestris]|nr:hypothetical protein CRUP_010430 [Coryphaenoides rupestris]
MMSLRQRHMDPHLAMGSQRLVESSLSGGPQQREEGPAAYPFRAARAPLRQSRSQSFGQFETLALPPLSSAVSHPSIPSSISSSSSSSSYSPQPLPPSFSPHLSFSASCLPSSVGGGASHPSSHLSPHAAFKPLDAIPDFPSQDSCDGDAGGSGDLNRSDSDTSLSLCQVGDRLPAYGGSKVHLVKPTSLLMHGLVPRAEDLSSMSSMSSLSSLHAAHANATTPNGGHRLYEGMGGGGGGGHPDAVSPTFSSVSESPILMKKLGYGMEKSASLGEIHSVSAESSRSFSPASTEPDTPSPTGGVGGGTDPAKGGGSRIPQLSSKKSPLEEDSGSTGEDTDSVASRKKHTFKIFKKQKK